VFCSCDAEENKLSSDGNNSGSKMQLRLWWRLRWGLANSAFGGSLESGCQLYVGEFDKNVAVVATKMFSHLIFLKAGPSGRTV
jgi:hypothetical protein